MNAPRLYLTRASEQPGRFCEYQKFFIFRSFISLTSALMTELLQGIYRSLKPSVMPVTDKGEI